MRLLLSLILSLPLIPSAFGWGGTGHRIIAMIAEDRLSPAARDQVHKLLLDGQFTMAQVSTCPDALRSAERNPIRPEEEYCLKIAAVTQGTSPWHYIDIPVPTYDKPLSAYCPNGDCVTERIKVFRDVLKNSPDDGKRREALMYLIHFVADMHQPLHCSERQCDQGGNREHVNVFLKSGPRPDHRLHGVWDSDLVDKLMENDKATDPVAYAKRLGRQINGGRAAKWSTVSVDQAAIEGWELAKAWVYRNIPNFNYCDPTVAAKPTPASDLSASYEKQGAKVVHDQILKASVRLADILETSLAR